MSHSSASLSKFSRFGRHSRSFRVTSTFLRRQLWVWPLIAAVVLAGLAWWVNDAVETVMRKQVAAELTAIRDADVTALRVWMKQQEADVKVLAMSDRIRPAVTELLAHADSDAALRQSPRQAELRAFLGPRMKVFGYTDFFVFAPSRKVIASSQDATIGVILTGYRGDLVEKALQRGAFVSRPFRSPFLYPDENGELRADRPTIVAGATTLDNQGRAQAVLSFRIRPEAEFTEILQVARLGKSGETFAFDAKGLLLSQSRFDDDLKEMGLLADLPDSHSVLTLELRDPGVNMTDGARPSLKRADQPLTKLVAAAVSGTSGVNVTGFRDYRGVPSVGAWGWLPDFEFGVSAKVDAAEAFRPLYVLRSVFWGLLALLVLSAAGIFAFMVYAAQQQYAAQKATLEARRLGQYTLEEKIGAGGMGSVYRARHAMLRRPTAVKLLDPEKMSPNSIARFEREVQLTSQLNHPNTITVYDYGRTSEGVFYYAMEYLEGITFHDLVSQYGPLPEGRVVHLLRQLCGSLAEAHACGLIHRDVKPANLILTCRGGIDDLVKVLDFGLVKAFGGEQDDRLTANHSLTGTPSYMSPEAISHPDTIDVRTDIYAVGAVGYFLLTKTPVFKADGLVELCRKHVQEQPESPSQRLGKRVSAAFEQVLLACLAKKPEDRPASAAVLLQALEQLEPDPPWSRADAHAWWAEFRSAAAEGSVPSVSESGIEIIQTVITGEDSVAGAVGDNLPRGGPAATE
jgi:eukaryotic-like serine/threonine-protein kinase